MDHLAKIRQGINVVITNNRQFINKNSYDLSECEDNLASANTWAQSYFELLVDGQFHDQEIMQQLTWICCLSRKCLQYAIALEERKRYNLELDIVEDALEHIKEEIDEISQHY